MSNKTLEATPEELKQWAAGLEANLKKLPAKDVGFAANMVKAGKKGTASSKQAYWLKLFHDKAVPPVHVNCVSASPVQTIAVNYATGENYSTGEITKKPTQSELFEDIGADYKALFSMFEEAKKHLKFPKFNIPMAAEGYAFRIYTAGSKSQYPGSLTVAIYSKIVYSGTLARILPDGRIIRTESGKKNPLLADLLLELAVDPKATVAKYGKLAGHCCFCALELTDEKSTKVGYGPVCAKHYGLPWGGEVTPVVETQEVKTVASPYAPSEEQNYLAQGDDLHKVVTEIAEHYDGLPGEMIVMDSIPATGHDSITIKGDAISAQQMLDNFFNNFPQVEKHTTTQAVNKLVHNYNDKLKNAHYKEGQEDDGSWDYSQH